MSRPSHIVEKLGLRRGGEHIYTKVLVRCYRRLARFGLFLHLPHLRKHRYLPHGSHFGAQKSLSGLPGCCWSARKGHSGLLRRCRCAQNGRSGLPRCRQCARKGCSGPLQRCQCDQYSCSGPLWWPYAPPKYRFWPALVLPVRSKSLSELASVPAVHSKSLFEPAVQDHYSKVLVSVALCSESLYSALLCYVHGYARVHTRIYNN